MLIKSTFALFRPRKGYINNEYLAAFMKTKFTMFIAIIMVLSGCTGGVEDAAEEIADVLTKGCMDKTAVNYDATAGETGNCVSKSVMTTNLIDFLTIVEEGPGDLQAKFSADESLAATMTIDETFEGETVNVVSSFIVDGVNDGFSTSTSITDSSGTWTMNMHHVGEDLVIKWNDTSARMKTTTTPLEFYLMDEDGGDDGEDDSGSDMDMGGDADCNPDIEDCGDVTPLDGALFVYIQSGDYSFGIAEQFPLYLHFPAPPMADNSPYELTQICSVEDGHSTDVYSTWVVSSGGNAGDFNNITSWSVKNNNTLQLDHFKYDPMSDIISFANPMVVFEDNASGSGHIMAEVFDQATWSCSDGVNDDDDGGMISMPESPDNPMDNMDANNTTWSGMDGMTVSGTDSMGGVISATLDASGAITSMSYSISEADTSGSDTTALNTASASMTLLSDTTITIDQSIELHSLPLLALSMAEMMGMMGGGSGPDDGPLPDGGPDDGGPDNGGPMWMAFNYCQWEAEGNERWDCTDNANGEDGFDDWWYYCEMHEDAAGVIIYHCTDDFGQNSEFESSASNDHYVTGGSPGGPNDGGTNAGHPAPEWWCSDEVGGMVNMSINWTNVNDGTEDCGDGSDEPHDFDGDGTIDNWWHCHDGTNITVDKINDGTNDCLFGSDEGLNDRPELIFIEDMYTEPFNDMSAGYNLTITFTNLSEGENYTYVYEVYHMNNNKTSNVVSEPIMGDSNGIASRELTISTSEWGESVWIESCYHLHVELTNETGIPIGSHAGHEIAIGAAECSGNPGDGSGNGGQNGNGNGGGNDGGAGMMGEGTYAIMGMDGIEGTLADYEAVLSQCTVGTLSERVCVDTNISMVLSTAPSPDSPIIFMDNDNSGTINSEDMIIVNDSLVTEEYNSVRLKYIPADKYSDENPLVLPGFTAGFSLMAMLGAALLLRRD